MAKPNESTHYTITEFQAKFCTKRPYEAYRTSREGSELTKLCIDRNIPFKKKKLKPIGKKQSTPETGSLHDLSSMNMYPRFILEEFYRAILKSSAKEVA
jgi:hypothetical protein